MRNTGIPNTSRNASRCCSLVFRGGRSFINANGGNFGIGGRGLVGIVPITRVYWMPRRKQLTSNSMSVRIILNIAGALIALGGMYDVVTPGLPPNLRERCGTALTACTVVRELLRALGGCLVAIGAAVIILANFAAKDRAAWPLWLILVLVVPPEGLNAFGMRRVGSPYLIPLAFAALAIAGVSLGLFVDAR